MHKKILFYFSVLSVVLLLSSCEDVFSPANENNRNLEQAYTHPTFAEGLLATAYNGVPSNGRSFTDLATDNAVSNDNSNAYRQMATGQWTSRDNPIGRWQAGRAATQYLNIFLANADKVQWDSTKTVNRLFNRRLKGEAYGLRALFMYYMIRANGGWTQSGESGDLLGIPIVLQPQDLNSAFNKPRDTFEDCMKQLYSDADSAIALLTPRFGDINKTSDLPDGFSGTSVQEYNRVFGESGKQRMSGRIARVIKARAALLAASPAYADGNTTTWEDAANYAGKIIENNGGVSGLAPKGQTWYNNADQLDNLGGGVNPPEIIWRTDRGESSNLEQQNFPPTLFGNGRINPTQNLVNAFPMANGYPIDDPASGYDPSNPYANRDPRLKEYVLVNGAEAGVNNTVITTAADGSSNDALNATATSTRTGYYLNKLLRQDVNTDPSATSGQFQFVVRMRYTEVYLDYAEAANEAYGPRGTGSFGFSAFDVIQAIRERAGITQPDAYLQSIGGNKDAMRELIRNERRLELSFEDHRFWDLRRWNADLTVPARGDRIVNGNHNTIKVENRVFDDYQNFGPVPHSEILKYDALQQNYGWQ